MANLPGNVRRLALFGSPMRSLRARSHNWRLWLKAVRSPPSDRSRLSYQGNVSCFPSIRSRQPLCPATAWPAPAAIIGHRSCFCRVEAPLNSCELGRVAMEHTDKLSGEWVQ